MLQKSDYESEVFPSFSPANSQDCRILVLQEMIIRESTRDRLWRNVFDQGDIVMGTRGEILGDERLYIRRSGDGFLASGSFVLKTSVES